MRVVFSRVASVILLSLSGLAFAAPQLVIPAPASGAQGRFPDMLEAGGGTAVRFNVKELASLPAESEVELTLPDARRYGYVLEYTESHGDGIRSFVARHKDLGNRYRAIVTNGPNGSFAVFSTPDGEFRLIPGDKTHDWLVDMSTQPAEPPLAAEKDWIMAPKGVEKAVQLHQATTFTAIPGVNVIPRAKDAPKVQSVIDIMFVVTNGLAANLGPNLNTRMNFIVTRANTAYADSAIAITLRLARIVQVNYSDVVDNNTALNAITPPSPPGFLNPGFDAATFGAIESQRTQAGADIVAFMRDGSDTGGAGLGWVSSQIPNATFMYSVTQGCVRGCESVVIHEIGHNMGNMHDRYTVAWQGGGDPAGSIDTGAFPYSYGYAFCNSGALSCNPNLPPASGGCAAATQPECSTTGGNNFSDIMAYFHASTERIYKFSNPGVTCASAAGDHVGRPCGIDQNISPATSANTAFSMNNLAAAISALKPPGAGQLQFSATTYSGAEGGSISFVVTRSGGGVGAVSVQYASANSTATAGLDFVAANGTLNWADGDNGSKTIVVPILADNAAEGSEAFTITLSNPTGGAVLGTPTTASGLIAGSFPTGTLGGLPTAPAGWSTPAGSSVAWAISNDSAPPGDADGLSMKSGAIPFGTNNCDANGNPGTTVPCPSVLQFTGNFQAGTISFAYRVFALPFGYGLLEFLVDGTVVMSADTPTDDADTGWLTYATQIAAGSHTLQWRYRTKLAFSCVGVFFTSTPQVGPFPGCADRAWIDQVGLPVTLATAGVALGSSVNPSSAGQSVTFTATVGGSSGTPTGAVTFRDGGVDIAGCVAVVLASSQAQCTTSALAPGSHSITAAYSGNTTYGTASSGTVTQAVSAGVQLLSANPTGLPFGGQSMNTTSPSQTVTLTNPTVNPVTVTTVTASTGYAATHNCTTVAANGGTCTVTVTFTPPAGPNTVALDGLVAISYAGGGPTLVNLTGVAERTLVTHYYRAILRRAPDGPGKVFWEGEATRMQSIGANVNEAWYAMAQFFFFSAEYIGLARDNTGFVTDLYVTFFNRQPDAGGLNFWVSQIGLGMPREVVLAGFMFSTEFGNFTQAIFGNTAARAEVDVVMDFYRGLLSRLPDPGGFTAWDNNFRTAQCQGGAAVNNMVEAISSGFALSAEYTGKNRTNAQYVGDLYNAFLRRGGDLGGVQFWINDLNALTRTRENVRQNFIASSEFQARVAAVVNQGCLP